MPKEEWGVKRVCPATGKRFYDLNRSPIVSPYTGEVVNIDTGTKTRVLVADKDDAATTKAKEEEDLLLEDDDEDIDEDIALDGDDDVLDDGDDEDTVPLEDITDVSDGGGEDD